MENLLTMEKLMGMAENEGKSAKIKRTSLTEQVFLNMKQCITDGTWKENEKIPSEGELAALYGVNKLTIRLALQQLNTLGIIETRVGEGSFVKKFNIFNYLDNISDFWSTAELIQDVMDFRRAVETACLRLACQNSTAADLEMLKSRLDDLELTREELYKKRMASPEKDEQFKILLHNMAVADYEFHAQISVMSHNALLELSYRIAKDSLIRYFTLQGQARIERVTARADDYIEYCKQNNHKNIYEALRSRDVEKCSRLGYKMFDYTSI